MTMIIIAILSVLLAWVLRKQICYVLAVIYFFTLWPWMTNDKTTSAATVRAAVIFLQAAILSAFWIAGGIIIMICAPLL